MNTRDPLPGRTGRASRLIPSLCLTAGLAALATAACAAPRPADRPESASTTVSFADLDLATEAGRAAANQRIASAAKRLCSRFSDERRAGDRETTLDCYRDAVARSQRHLAAALAAAHVETAQVARNTP